MIKTLKGLGIIYAATALLIFGAGALSFGTFPALGIGSVLVTAFAVSVSAFVFYNVIGLAICAPLGIKRPGFALPTVLGTVTGAAGIGFSAWLMPGNVLSEGFFAAMPFAFMNTLFIWAIAYCSGYLKNPLTLWPER